MSEDDGGDDVLRAMAERGRTARRGRTDQRPSLGVRVGRRVRVRLNPRVTGRAGE